MRDNRREEEDDGEDEDEDEEEEEEEEEEDEEEEDEEEEEKPAAQEKEGNKQAEGEEEEKEVIVVEGLHIPKDQIEILRQAFVVFDQDKRGFLKFDMIGTILELLGHSLTPEELQNVINEVDTDGSGELEFEEFCLLAAKFLAEDDEENMNEEVMTKELKEAFRYYDREENGCITTDDFKDIIRELDPGLKEDEVCGMVSEIDLNGSGTVDFEEFMKALR